MTETTKLEAKVLLLEHDPEQLSQLRAFCEDVGLMVLECPADEVPQTLKAHQDLAGVFISEALLDGDDGAWPLVVEIHQRRAELPIFLRRKDQRTLDVREQNALRHQWTPDTFDTLHEAVDRAIFSLRYPKALMEGVTKLSVEGLSAMFPNAEVTADKPYVVHDRLIYGKVSTLIALESSWCRGYMMLQTEEDSLRVGLMEGLSYEGIGGDLNFRELNNMLAETTNLIWGAFKNRYIPPKAFAKAQTQVPIVINHQHKYITFGSPDPQLCIRYQLRDKNRPDAKPLLIVQRFIFNLLWNPHEYEEFVEQAPEAPPTGELELF